MGQVPEDRLQMLPLQIDHDEVEQRPVKDVDPPVFPDVVPQQPEGQTQQDGEVDLGHIVENRLRYRSPTQKVAQDNARHHDGQGEHDEENTAVVSVLEHDHRAVEKPDAVNSEAQGDPLGRILILVKG